jgi:hypothetical protein
MKPRTIARAITSGIMRPVPEDDLSDIFAGLETDINAEGKFDPPVKRSTGKDAKVVKFPCAGCGGTGVWRGRGKCFACKGQGYFLTSERDRQNARQRAVVSKTKKLADTRAAFEEGHPGLAHTLVGMRDWNTFAGEMVDKLDQYGSLTEPQVAAVNRMLAKIAATRAAKQAERQAASQTVDLSPIRAMFEAARASGHKTPVYRAAGLVISRAPDYGKNPGALYVKTEDDEYLGKILGTSYTGKAAPALAAIAADPRGEAIKYGQRTGNCSCCGRLLTAENSVAAGIGPICAEKWGL